MDIISEVSETLAVLLAESGAGDPTFQRMVSVYDDVTTVLGRRGEYERVLAGLRAATARREQAGGASGGRVFVHRDAPSLEHSTDRVW